ncbi:MAG: hypothetical protein JSW66_00375 [Phycisphaerales bacterium]|nr:MAG: hypothetical protein JSW66_00375 [Phycisphaerales bacterium]
MAKSVKRRKQKASPAPQTGDSSVSEEAAATAGPRALAGWPMIIGWAAMLIFTFHACTHMVAAGDTWVAMACGRHFVHHGVDTVEPFSANSHKPGPTPEEIATWPGWARWIAETVGLDAVKACHPTGWINQNWLTHVIFYSLVPESSYADGLSFSSNALVYWKFTVYILAILCVYYTGRLLGVNPVLCAVVSCFALFAGRSYIDIRPAGFSNLLVAVFLLVLVLASYRNILYVWLIVPVTVFWCNVHGGYIYVFITLVPFVGLHLLTSFSKKRFRSIGLRGVCHTVAAGAVTLLAVIALNPFHLTNLTHTFVVSVSKHAERWRDIHEWQSAFDWTNRVGTGFPFLVLYILSIGLVVLWVFARFLVPRFLKAPTNELEAQRKLFGFLSRIFGAALCVFVFWVTFVSFSFLALDAGSFFICALFAMVLMLSVYKSIHFIYLVVPLILLAVWSGDPLAGYDSRYFYPFVLVPAYVLLHILASLISKTVKRETRNIGFVAAAAVASLVLMVLIFDPFKFDKSIWHVQQFLDLQRLSRPVYERNLEVTYAHLFDGLYVVNILAIVVWLGIPFLRSAINQAVMEPEGPPADDTYRLPRIDLGIMAVAALTIYMAVRSRRFIPIAAIAACPIVAMLTEQTIQAFSAARNFHTRGRLTVSRMPHSVQLFCVIAGAVVVLFLGTAWAVKFKRVYLDAWPSDARLNSVFMRMTASDAKPFYAMKFIKDNELSGKMFNYWTEGGFIAWGQEPDPNTGRTPLQLFMDGRAQAAYNRSTFDLWSHVMAGGQITGQTLQRTQARGQPVTASDYVKIGQWMDEQMQAYNIWVVLMPAVVFADPDQKAMYHAIKGIEYNPNWRLVFLSRRQKLFVDIRTQRGKELFGGILTGQTRYPDDYHRNLILARTYFLFLPELADRKRGLDHALEAFKQRRSPTPMLETMAFGAKYPDLKPEVDKFCEAYVQEFTQNQELWAQQDGYRLHLESARLACYHLKTAARARGDMEVASRYALKESECLDETAWLSASKRW